MSADFVQDRDTILSEVPMNSIVGLIRALESNSPPAHQQPILNSLRSSASNLVL